MYRLQCNRALRALVTKTLTRSIHTTLMLQSDYYKDLGIAKTSTQSEIKAAYYKMSKVYHPDKNQGSDSAAKKFREITQAYEVLGNYRLRRLYDKGIIHTAGSQYASQTADDLRKAAREEMEEDDAETKFYKSRFKKSKVADEEGRTPIYDFDKWSRAHYGKSFDRRQYAKKKFERREAQKVTNTESKQTDIVMISFLFGAFAVYLMFISESSYDTPKQRAEARHAERERIEVLEKSRKA